ncbi:hypothetical protein [Paraburkholderia unamae]|uniref:hypothetical protein n=1 Tax=Paraburkholderia unamae TaxID=219649 RepID=UPI0011BE7755|nr:hypothetical protein [Paraburkholderia unamae]
MDGLEKIHFEYEPLRSEDQVVEFRQMADRDRDETHLLPHDVRLFQGAGVMAAQCARHAFE